MKFHKPLFFWRFFLSFGLFITAFFLTACENYHFDSSWRDREIKIDGSSEDWTNSMQYLENEKLYFGIVNDNDFLYLCVSLSNKNLSRQIVMQGLTIWFDSGGNNSGTFGIHYPIGIKNMYSNVIKTMFGRNTDKSLNEAMNSDLFSQQFDEFEIFQSKNGKPSDFYVNKLKGIEAKISNTDEILTYELKLPISKNTNYISYIAKKPGELIKLIFKAPANDISENTGSDNNSGRSPWRQGKRYERWHERPFRRS